MKNILFIYDFDDTLFPSFNYTIEKYYTKHKWNMLDNKIYLILYNSLLIGHVIILSDAMSNWINNILSNLNKTRDLINNYIKIYTTTDLMMKYKFKYPLFYKYEKIKYILNYYLFNNINCIINIGDGNNEYIATLLIHKNFNNINLTHIKMLKKPNFNQLIQELSILNNNINKLLCCKNNKEFFFYLSNIRNNTI